MCASSSYSAAPAARASACIAVRLVPLVLHLSPFRPTVFARTALHSFAHVIYASFRARDHYNNCDRYNYNYNHSLAMASAASSCSFVPHQKENAVMIRNAAVMVPPSPTKLSRSESFPRLEELQLIDTIPKPAVAVGVPAFVDGTASSTPAADASHLEKALKSVVKIFSTHAK